MSSSTCSEPDKAVRPAGVSGWGWPLFVFVLALLPRLFELGRQPLWLDEVLTLNRASLAPGALALNSFQNHHMPGFFLLLSPLTGLGEPQFWLRVPSAIFGAVAVMLVFMIAARLAGWLAGGLAALVLGLSPAVLGFAQEARSYTLVMTLILVALYGVTRLAQDLRAAGQGFRAAKAGWLCFVLGTAAALDVLGDAVPWWLAANLIFFFLLPFTPARWRLVRNVLLADLAVLLLTAPLYALLLHYQAESVAHSLGWIPKLDAKRVWYNFGAVYLMHVPDWVSFRFLTRHAVPGVVWLVDALLLAALAAAVWRLRRRVTLLIVLGIAFLLLPCLFLLLSLWHPVLLPRYLLWSAAPMAVLVGIGGAALLEARPVAVRGLAVVAVAGLLLVNLLPYYKDEAKPRWDLAAQILAREFSPGDMILFSDGGAVPILKVYLPKAARETVLSHPYGGLHHAEAALNQGRRVWVVYGHAGQNTGTARQFFAKMQTLGVPSKVQAAGRRIAIVLYAPGQHLASCTELAEQDGICG